MKFYELVYHFAAIADISSRTAITQELAQLFEKSTPQEAKIVTNLALGVLRPSYEGTQFSIAERSIKKILRELLDVSEARLATMIKNYGDLGSVAAQGSWHTHKKLTVQEVYDALIALEDISGVGAQEDRLSACTQLLRSLDPADAGVVIRILLGKLRLGFSDMTMIDALSWMLVGDKSLHEQIEHAYNICADLGHIAYLLKVLGKEGLDKVAIRVGIPIRPAAAERLPTAAAIFEKLGACVAQPKLDGFRLQIHLDYQAGKKKIRFFSRNLIDMSQMFPDLVAALENLPIQTCIMEGEAIAYDEHTGTFTPFQETVKRKRKHDIDTVSQELPLKLFLFDLLYLDGDALLNREHHTRRKLLNQLIPADSHIISVVEERSIHTAQELEHYFNEAIDQGLEGLVVKKPHAHYQPGKRNFNWIKLKRHIQSNLEDTIDAVVLGYYYGKGKRAEFGIGAFLVAVYHKKQDRFETVAKIGTGLTDAGWIELKKKSDQNAVSRQPHNVLCPKELIPDVWVEPSFVVMIGADEITRSPLHTAGKTSTGLGYALRFPRMLGYRPDKQATQATTVDELIRLYEDQKL